MVQLAPHPAPSAPRGHRRLPVSSPLRSYGASDPQHGRTDDPVSTSPSVRERGGFVRRLRWPTEFRLNPKLLGALMLVIVAVGVAGGSVLARSKPATVGVSLQEVPLTPAAVGVAPTVGALAGAAPRATISAPTLPTTVAASVSSSPVSSSPPMVVHAAGAIRLPGVYVMNAGSRAADVVFAAGGLTTDADGDRLNLAQPVVDGSRLYVPRKGAAVPLVPSDQLVGGVTPSPSPLPGDAPNASGPLDLNAATATQLDALPGVGPATAASIVEYRTKIGRFKSVNQLLDVPGIGEAKLAAMRKRLVVG